MSYMLMESRCAASFFACKKPHILCLKVKLVCAEINFRNGCHCLMGQILYITGL